MDTLDRPKSAVHRLAAWTARALRRLLLLGVALAVLLVPAGPPVALAAPAPPGPVAPPSDPPSPLKRADLVLATIGTNGTAMLHRESGLCGVWVLYQVENVGAAAAGGFWLHLAVSGLSGPPLTTLYPDRGPWDLPAGQTLSFWGPTAAARPVNGGCAHLKGATFFVTITADSTQAVSEWQEGNNAKTAKVTVTSAQP